MIGGVIMAHGDDRGLILPPRIAPYQVVIVPIGRDDELDGRRRSGRPTRWRISARRSARPRRRRTHLSPGFKFNEWELRGVPLRLELGPRDLARGRRRRRRSAERRETRHQRRCDLVAEVTRAARRLPGGAVSARPRLPRRAHDDVPTTFDELVAGVATGFCLRLPLRRGRVRGADPGRDRRYAALHPPRRRAEAEGPCVVCGKPSAYGTRDPVRPRLLSCERSGRHCRRAARRSGPR